MDTHKITKLDWTEYMCGFRCPLCDEPITLTDAGDWTICKCGKKYMLIAHVEISDPTPEEIEEDAE